MNSFGVLVVTSAEHFELSSKSDNSLLWSLLELDSTQLNCQLSIVAADGSLRRLQSLDSMSADALAEL